MRFAFLLFAVLLAASAASAGEFCAVNQGGYLFSCYPTLATCQQVAASMNGACSYRETPSNSSSVASDYNSGWAAGQALGQILFGGQQQSSRDAAAARRATDPRLLPLVGPDDYVSPESQAMIFSTLKTALEMDAPNSKRTWTNPTKGSVGTVTVGADSTSRYGQTCREFALTLTTKNGHTGNTAGTACRTDSGWVWQ
jgi:hypothetical protein